MNFSLADKTQTVCLKGIEIIKLAKTRLNKWAVNGETITIEPGDVGNTFAVSYAPYGKYSTDKRVNEFFGTLGILFILVLYMLNLVAGEHLFLGLLLLVASVYGLNYYRKVSAILDANGVLLRDENGQDHLLAFDDVKRVEKGVFRTKVTGKDGRVLFFPQAFHLLPELIEEYAGLKR